MKTKYFAIAIALLLIACLGLSVYFLVPRGNKAYVTVVQDGVETMELDLSRDQTLTLTGANGGKNVVNIKDGKIAVLEADCPDHICMAMGYRSGGAPIACLPNGLILSFSDAPGMDAAAG